MFLRNVSRARQYGNFAKSIGPTNNCNKSVLLRRPCVIVQNFSSNDCTNKNYGLRFQSTQPPNDDKQKSLTNAQKLKKAVAEYGATVIVFHVGISLISLGTCYVAVSSGLDINELFIAVGLKEWAMKNSLVSNAGTFALAYAVHKVFAPVRIMITLASVPFIVRYLRSKGILKK